ncbi:titin-like [Anneissia japonica]|uniref:titin-like n=1 Tax=Anneissia japonica TaxID=1529436 RepID=UPI0014256694|nr:titin-like [Anneissia japonica]
MLLTFIICRCLCDIFRGCERCCDTCQCGDICRCCCDRPRKVTIYRTEHRHRRHIILKAAVLCFLLIFITATLIMGVMATRSPALQYVFAVLNGCIGFVLLICVYLLSKHVEREYVPSVIVDSSIHGQTLVDVQYDPEITVSGYRRDYVNEGFEMREPTSQEPGQTQLSRKKYTRVFYTDGSSEQQQYYSDRRNEQVNIRYVDEQPEVVRRRDVNADVIVERRPKELRERVDIEQDVVTGKYYTDSDYQQTSVGRKVIITEHGQREPEHIRRTRARKEMDAEIMVERRPRELRERVDIEQDAVTGKYYRDSDYRQKSVGTKVIITEDEQREPEGIRETRARKEMDSEIMVERKPRELRERVDIEQDVVTGKYYRDSDYQQRSVGKKVIITEDIQREPERIRGTRSREEMDAEIRVESRPTELRGRVDIEQDVVTGKYYRDSDYQQKNVEKRVIITEDEQREPERIRKTRGRKEVDADIIVERRPKELRERVDIEQDVVTGKYYRDGDYQQKSVGRKVIITEDEQREPERIREIRARKEMDADIIVERRPKELRERVDIEQDVVTGKYYRDGDYQTKSVERRVIITEDEQREPERIRETRSREEMDADIVIETRPRELRERVDIEQDVVTDKYYPRDSDYQQGSDERKVIISEDLQREPERIRGTRSREEMDADIIIERSGVDMVPKQSKRYMSTITLQGTDIFEKLRVEKLFELENYLESRVPSRFDDRKIKFIIQDFGGGLTQLARYSDESSLFENIRVDRPFEAYIVNGDGSPVVDRPFMFNYDRNTDTFFIASTRRFSQPDKYYTSRERIEYARPKETSEEFTDKTNMQKLPKFKRIENDDLENESINALDIIQLIIPYPDENRYDIRYMIRCKEGPWDTVSLPANETYVEVIIVERDGTLEQLVILKYEDKNTYSIVQSNTDIDQLKRSVRTEEEYRQIETYPIKRRKPVFKRFKERCCGKDQKKQKYTVVEREESLQRPKQQEVVEMSTTSITTDDRRKPVERRREFPQRPRQQEFIETTATTTIVPAEKTYEGEIRPLVREEREKSPQRLRQQEYVEVSSKTITEEKIKEPMKASDGETTKTWVLQRRGESPRRQQEYIEETTTATITDETTRQPGGRRRESPHRYRQQEELERATTTFRVDGRGEPTTSSWVGQKRRESPHRYRQEEIETATTTFTVEERAREPTSKTWVGEKRLDMKPSDGEIRGSVDERRWEFPRRRTQPEYTETRLTTDERTSLPAVKTFDGEIQPLVEEQVGESPQHRQQEYEQRTTTIITDEGERAEKPLVGKRVSKYPSKPRRQEYIEITTDETTVDENIKQPAEKKYDSENKKWVRVGDRRWESSHKPRRQEYTETTTTTYDRKREPAAEISDDNIRTRVIQKPWESPRRLRRQDYAEKTTTVEEIQESTEKTFDGEIRTSTTATTIEERPREPVARKPGGVWIGESRGYSPQSRRQQAYVERPTTTTETEETTVETFEGDIRTRVGERQPEYIEKTTFTTTTTDKTHEEQPVKALVEEQLGEYPRQQTQREYERFTTTTKPDYGEITLVFEMPKQEYVETTISTTKTGDTRTEPDSKTTDDEIVAFVEERVGESPQRPRQEYVQRSITTTKTKEIKEPGAKPSGDEIPSWVLQRRGESPQRPRQEYVETSITTTKTNEEIEEPGAKPSGDVIPPWVLKRRGESPQRPRQEYVESSITTTKTKEEIKEPDAKPSGSDIPSWVLQRRGESPQRPRQEYVERRFTTTKTEEEIKQPGATPSDGEIPSWVLQRRGESPQRPRPEYVETSITTTKTKEDIEEPVAKPSGDEIPSWVLQRRGESPQRPRQEYIESSITTTKTKEEIKEPDAKPSGGDIPSWVLQRRGESPQRPRQEYVERRFTTTKREEEIKQPGAKPSDGEIPTWVLERRGESPQRPRQEYVETSVTTTKTKEDIEEPVAKPYGDEIPSWVLQRRGESPQRPRQEYVERRFTTTKTEEEIKQPDAKPSDGEIPTWVLERRSESPQRPRQEYVETSITTTKTKEDIVEPVAKPSADEIPSWVLQRRGESPQRPRQEYVETSVTTTKTKEDIEEPVAKPYGDEIPSWVLQRRGESPQRPRQEYVERRFTTTKTEEEIQQPGAKPSDGEIPSWVLQRRGESPQRPRQEYAETSITTTKTKEDIEKPVAKPSGDEIPSWVLQRRGESPQRPRQDYVERSITTTKTKEEIKQPGSKPSGDEIPSWVLKRHGESPQRPTQEYVETSITTTKTKEDIEEPVAKPSGDEIPSWVLQRRGETPQRPRQEYIEKSITTTKTKEEIKEPGAKPSGDEIPSWVLKRRGESPQRPRQEYVESSITTTKTKEEIEEFGAKPSSEEIPSWVLQRRGETPQRPRQEYIESSITTTKTEEKIKEPDTKPSDGEIPSWVLKRRSEFPQQPRQEYVETTISTTKTETTKKPEGETTGGEIFALVEEQLGESPQLPRQEYIKKTTTTTTTAKADDSIEQPAAKSTEGIPTVTYREIKYEEDGVQRFVAGSSTTVQQIYQGSSDLQSGEFISGTGDASSSSMAYGMSSESARMVSGEVSEIVRDDSQVTGDIQERMTVTESRHTFRSHPSTESGQHRFRTEISGVVLRPRPPTSSFGSDVSSIVHDVTDDIKKSYFSFTESL